MRPKERSESRMYAARANKSGTVHTRTRLSASQLLRSAGAMPERNKKTTVTAKNIPSVQKYDAGFEARDAEAFCQKRDNFFTAVFIFISILCNNSRKHCIVRHAPAHHITFGVPKYDGEMIDKIRRRTHSSGMQIRFTKTSLTHHTLEITRDDGTKERAELETKTFMPHDLIHLAYESEAGLSDSFWGSLAKGMRFSDFDSPEKVRALVEGNDELCQTEMTTGLLAGYLQGGMSETEALLAAQNMFGAHGLPIPAWITESFLHCFKERFRKYWGHWNALKKDELLELSF